eukprot:SAG11_NODE_828_length_6964_cov_34.418063_1_plen_51_part_00
MVGIYENFLTDIFRKIVGSPIESTPKTKTVHRLSSFWICENRHIHDDYAL